MLRKPNSDYPCLMRHTVLDIVVLFSSEGSGTVVGSFNNSDLGNFSLGEYRNSWCLLFGDGCWEDIPAGTIASFSEGTSRIVTECDHECHCKASCR
jgi:hypothetical protein